MRKSPALCILSVLFMFSCTEDKNDPLKACFVVPENVVRNQEVSFEASCSQRAATFKWDFGDGTTSTQSNPKHTFLVDGIYPVKLRVEGQGMADSVTVNVTVNLSDSEKNCRPSSLTLPGFWPHQIGTWTKGTISYHADKRFNEIQFFNSLAVDPTFAIKAVYNTDNTVKAFEWYRRFDSSLPMERTTSFNFTYDNTGKVSQVLRVSHLSGTPREEVRNSFTYDLKGRMIEITSDDLNFSSPRADKVIYVYGTDGNVKTATYPTNTMIPKPISRENKNFIALRPFYAASKELTLYFEYVCLVEPLKNVYTSVQIYNMWEQYGNRRYFTNDNGAVLNYFTAADAKGLIKSYYQNLSAETVYTEVVFQTVEYTCD